ncbi:MAG TPA: discoidin domain-containing protein [Polyangiaceae bacterium]|nr:discoidin domain-containing protein [Polyangiaceae bacterium]
MRSSVALSLVGACWFSACSFPDYATDPPEVDKPSVCADEMPSEAESDIDCGGGCPACGMGRTCRMHSDCESLACDDGTCQLPTCTDEVKNGAEADIDCGGVCDPCPFGSDCRKAEDCAEHVCSKSRCQVPSCTDRVQNGDETAMDCGGSCGSKCENGQECEVDQDCSSQHCVEAVCVAPDCTDRIRANSETDVDCGGPDCGPCAATKSCSVATDCMSLICDANEVCAAYSCDDRVVNGEETGPDCGGSSCAGCKTLEPCEGGRDCASGACQSSLCVPAAPTGKELDRSGWDASASSSRSGDDPDQVLDNDRSPLWTSGTSQVDGMWFEVDMGELRTFFKVVLVCEEQESDFMDEFDFYTSTDGTYGPPAKTGLAGKTVTEVGFDTAQVARYFTFVVRQDKSKWLSIDEIMVFE